MAFRSEKACSQNPGFCVLGRGAGAYGGGGSSVSTALAAKRLETSCISGTFDMFDGDGGGESSYVVVWIRSRRDKRGRIGLRGAQKWLDGFSKNEDARCAGAGCVSVRVDM